MFSSRRKARAVGQAGNGDEDDGGQDLGSAVKRPSRPKNRSRISLGAGGTSMADEDEEERVVIAPKRGLARRAMESNAANFSEPAEVATNRAGAGEDERPSYDQAYLRKLKESQKSQPSTSSADVTPVVDTQELDVASKFGKDMSLHRSTEQNTLIPTDAEIQEKKARRARLAKLAKYNIDPEDSENDSEHEDRPGSDEDEFLTQRDKISLRDTRSISKKEVDTRLVRDDEDMLEGFDEFTNESGRVALGDSAQSEAKARQRAEMKDMIDAAQDADEDDDEISDREQRDEYEEVQTRKGIEIMHVNGREEDEGARTPPRITPIPSFTEAMQKILDRVNQMDAEKQAKLQRLEEITAEKKESEQRQIDIEKLLQEASAKYAQLAKEAGVEANQTNGSSQPALLEGRGLEDVGPPDSGSANQSV